jgi:hypothetical protein
MMGQSASRNTRVVQLNCRAADFSLTSGFVGSKRFQSLLQQFPPQFFFLIRRNIRVTDDVNYPIAQYRAIGADHFGNR